MKLTDLIEAVDLLRKEGWTVEPPAKRGSTAARLREKLIGRPPKNGRRRRRGRPRKQDM